MASGGTGVLYLVATPIGNLEDITLRAIRTLREADLVAAEDTRRTRTLFARHGIESPLTSYHEHNERRKARELLEELKRGKSVAVVSDAGTPGISDPAYRLVSLAVDEGIEVVAVPGPNSAIAALSVSGLPTDRFVFEGFLPWKKGARAARLKELAVEPRTVVFFESPRRVVKLLSEIEELWGARRVAVARELTKRFEEVLRGEAAAGRESREARGVQKGEFVVVVEGLGRRARRAADQAKIALDERDSSR
jgi:16S rRNA (cytidine1402-2'-O)-methyltransferase